MSAKVLMYTTLVCPYCQRAKQLLKARGVDAIEEVRIDQDPAQLQAMMQRTGRRTVPQIFIGDTHVGGCDDLIALDQRGGLSLAASPPACGLSTNSFESARR
jgi:glutaredoxin 3